MGTRELRKACPTITARWDRPLALCYLRCTAPQLGQDVAPGKPGGGAHVGGGEGHGGQHQEASPRSRPLVGSRWSHSANTVMRNRASQKPGTDSSRGGQPLEHRIQPCAVAGRHEHAASPRRTPPPPAWRPGDLEGDGQPGHQLLGDVLVADVGAAQIPRRASPSQSRYCTGRAGPGQLGAHIRPVLLRGNSMPMRNSASSTGSPGAMRPSRKAARRCSAAPDEHQQPAADVLENCHDPPPSETE